METKYRIPVIFFSGLTSTRYGTIIPYQVPCAHIVLPVVQVPGKNSEYQVPDTVIPIRHANRLFQVGSLR